MDRNSVRFAAAALVGGLTSAREGGSQSSRGAADRINGLGDGAVTSIVAGWRSLTRQFSVDILRVAKALWCAAMHTAFLSQRSPEGDWCQLHCKRCGSAWADPR